MHGYYSPPPPHQRAARGSSSSSNNNNNNSNSRQQQRHQQQDPPGSRDNPIPLMMMMERQQAQQPQPPSRQRRQQRPDPSVVVMMDSSSSGGGGGDAATTSDYSSYHHHHPYYQHRHNNNNNNPKRDPSVVGDSNNNNNNGDDNDNHTARRHYQPQLHASQASLYRARMRAAHVNSSNSNNNEDDEDDAPAEKMIQLSNRQLALLAAKRQQQQQLQLQQQQKQKQDPPVVVGTATAAATALQQPQKEPPTTTTTTTRTTTATTRRRSSTTTNQQQQQQSQSQQQEQQRALLRRMLQQKTQKQQQKQQQQQQYQSRGNGNSSNNNNNKSRELDDSFTAAKQQLLQNVLRRNKQQQQQQTTTTASATSAATAGVVVGATTTTKNASVIGNSSRRSRLPREEQPQPQHQQHQKQQHSTSTNTTNITTTIKARYEAEKQSQWLTQQTKAMEQGYQEFLHILQSEVAGQHSQLWESFSAICQNRPPLLLEQPVNHKSTKKKSFKFDAATKQLLLELNLHLKEQQQPSPHKVECVGASQLVNDKKYFAQMANLMQQHASIADTADTAYASAVSSVASMTAAAAAATTTAATNDHHHSTTTTTTPLMNNKRRARVPVSEEEATTTGRTRALHQQKQQPQQQDESSLSSRLIIKSSHSLSRQKSSPTQPSDVILQQRSTESSSSSSSSSSSLTKRDAILQARGKYEDDDSCTPIIAAAAAAKASPPRPPQDTLRRMGALTDQASCSAEDNDNDDNDNDDTDFEDEKKSEVEVTLVQYESMQDEDEVDDDNDDDASNDESGTDNNSVTKNRSIASNGVNTYYSNATGNRSIPSRPKSTSTSSLSQYLPPPTPSDGSTTSNGVGDSGSNGSSSSSSSPPWQQVQLKKTLPPGSSSLSSSSTSSAAKQPDKSPAFLNVRLRKVPSPEQAAAGNGSSSNMIDNSSSNTIATTTPRAAEKNKDSNVFFTPLQQPQTRDSSSTEDLSSPSDEDSNRSRYLLQGSSSASSSSRSSSRKSQDTNNNNCLKKTTTLQTADSDSTTSSLYPVSSSRSSQSSARTTEIATTRGQGHTTVVPATGRGTSESPIIVTTATDDSNQSSSSSTLHVAVPLRLEPGQTEAQRVVVTKQDVWIEMVLRNNKSDATATSAPTTTTTVLWKLPRFQVQSLNLDMATCQAVLLLQDNQNKKTLSFGSSEDCLRFANAMYEVSSSGSLSSVGEGSSSRIADNIPLVVDRDKGENSMNNDDDDSATEVSLLEALNDEEQKLLETFRRLRKTKSAEEAMQESLPQVDIGAGTAAPSTLSEAEDDIAQKYRGMLRMSFPLTVVKEKMSRDGVDPKIVAVVVSEATSSSSSSSQAQPPPPLPPQFVNPLPSSPVSTFSASTLLSAAEQETVESYKKMLKMRIPVDAVKHKMTKDQVDQKIVVAVLGQEGSTTSNEGPESLTEDEQGLVDGYKKMLKMGFPEDVVRHKMKRDEASEKVVNAVFCKQQGEGGNEVGTSEASKPLSVPEMAVAAKYKKLLTLGVDPDGVRHKMTTEEVDPRIIDHVLGGNKSSAPPKPEEPLPPKKKSALTPDEESVASQFRKMIKLQIPRDTVLSRMQQEGVSEKIISAVLGPKVPKVEGVISNDTANNPGSKLVALHWTPLSGKELDESVWSRASKKRSDPEIETGPEGSDITKLIQLFQKKTKAMGVRSKTKADVSNGLEKAKLLDLTRSNNVAISLKAFKEFSFAELANIINFLDPCRKVRGERVQFLRDLLPTVTEVKVISEYEGSEDRLVPAEIWFQHVVPIKRVETKAQVLRTMEMFNGEAEMLMDSFKVLTSVCRQVVQSEKLQDLLEMILSIGNIMNEGTRTGGASGFKFDSLLRLTQTKSSDGKTTVLDFLVNMFVSKGQRETLLLSDDFPEIQTASRMLVTDLTKEVKELGDALDQCKSELEALTKENTPPEPETPPEGDSSDPRSALLNALKARGGSDAPKPPKPEVFAQREKFLARLKEKKAAATLLDKKHQVGTEEKVDSSNTDSDESENNNIEGGMDRLRRFIALETETYAELLQLKNDALEACRTTAKYCGESGGVGSAIPLLGVLAQFATNLSEALEKHDRMQQAAADRSKRRREKTGQITHVAADRVSIEDESKEKKSLVLMVNELLKNANERTKDDFKKGRYYENPSKTLKQIYELERNAVNDDSAAPSIAERKDIVATIRDREAKINNDDFQNARSKFGGVTSPDSPSRDANMTRSRSDSTAGTLQKQLFEKDESFTSSSAAQRLRKTEHSLPPHTPFNKAPESVGNTSSDGESPQEAIKSVADAVRQLNQKPSQVPDAIQKLGSSPLTYSPPRKRQNSLSPPKNGQTVQSPLISLEEGNGSVPNDENTDLAAQSALVPVPPSEAIEDSTSTDKTHNDPVAHSPPVSMPSLEENKNSPSTDGTMPDSSATSTAACDVLPESSVGEKMTKHSNFKEDSQLGSNVSTSTKPSSNAEDIQSATFDLSGSQNRLKAGKVSKKPPSVVDSTEKMASCSDDDLAKSLAAIDEAARLQSSENEQKENSLLFDLVRRMSLEKTTPHTTQPMSDNEYFPEERVLKASQELQPDTPSSPISRKPMNSSEKKGESAVARLARLRREERTLKAKLSPETLALSPEAAAAIIASPTGSGHGTESAVTRLARKMRMDRKKGSVNTGT